MYDDPYYLDDPRRKEWKEPETDKCRYCGAVTPVEDLVILFQDEICCPTCLIDVKKWDVIMNQITPLKPYNL